MSATVRISVEVDGARLDVEQSNNISGHSPDLGRRQLISLLDDAIGKVARAYDLDYTFLAGPKPSDSGVS